MQNQPLPSPSITAPGTQTAAIAPGDIKELVPRILRELLRRPEQAPVPSWLKDILPISSVQDGKSFSARQTAIQSMIEFMALPVETAVTEPPLSAQLMDTITSVFRPRRAKPAPQVRHVWNFPGFFGMIDRLIRENIVIGIGLVDRRGDILDPKTDLAFYLTPYVGRTVHPPQFFTLPAAKIGPARREFYRGASCGLGASPPEVCFHYLEDTAEWLEKGGRVVDGEFRQYTPEERANLVRWRKGVELAFAAHGLQPMAQDVIARVKFSNGGFMVAVNRDLEVDHLATEWSNPRRR